MKTEKTGSMNLKSIHFLNNLISNKQADADKNENTHFSDLMSLVAENQRATENQYFLRFKEMEEINTHLEKIIELRKKELAEVVGTNTKFISIIAHDLRGPFGSIIGALGILKDSLEKYKQDEVKNLVNIASESANNAFNLLNNLLDWTISQNKEKNFCPVKINLYELVASEISSVHAISQQKQLTLNLSIAPDLNVSADIQMVKTILRNLVSNAVKFTKAGGEVTIGASEDNPFVEIGVKDNGIGISYEAQKKLFKTDSFFTTLGTNNERGTGLGLLLVKEFVEIHGGKIRVESEPCKGSEFKFTLPHYI